MYVIFESAASIINHKLDVPVPVQHERLKSWTKQPQCLWSPGLVLSTINPHCTSDWFENINSVRCSKVPPRRSLVGKFWREARVWRRSSMLGRCWFLFASRLLPSIALTPLWRPHGESGRDDNLPAQRTLLGRFGRVCWKGERRAFGVAFITYFFCSAATCLACLLIVTVRTHSVAASPGAHLLLARRRNGTLDTKKGRHEWTY